MTTGMNFWDFNVWAFLLTISELLIAMIVAQILRNNIKLIKQTMIPSSVLGGFLLLLVHWLFKSAFGIEIYKTSTLEILTYHGLDLGFAALALRNTPKKTDGVSKTGAFDSGVTVVNGYLLQAVIGLLITIILYKAIGSFFASGIILPMGYGQGPGQAYNWGHTYEMQHGFEHGTSFGLAIAAMGFVSASVGGVICLNRMKKNGIFKGEIGQDAVEEYTVDTFTGKNEIPVTESMDKFTIQVALVFISYTLAYAVMIGLNKLLDPSGRFRHSWHAAGYDLGISVPVRHCLRNTRQDHTQCAHEKRRDQAQLHQQLYAEPHIRLHVRYNGRRVHSCDRPERFQKQRIRNTSYSYLHCRCRGNLFLSEIRLQKDISLV